MLTAFKAIVSWAKPAGPHSRGELFGMSVDDPHVTPKPRYRYEVCLAAPGPFTCAKGRSKLKMPAMRYATTRVVGDLRLVATTWDHLFRGWLLHRGYEPAHAPALEIFLDKENATDWSRFDLELCLPVQALTAPQRR